MDVENRKMIAAILEPKPRFFFPKWLRKCEFLIDGEIYTERDNDINKDLSGFYDFLRYSNLFCSYKKIVGIRVTLLPDDKNSSMICSLELGSGLKIIDVHHIMPILEIYHGSIRSYRNEYSGDQFFDSNYILKNASGGYAMTFGLSYLPPEEIREIESWCIDSR